MKSGFLQAALLAACWAQVWPSPTTRDGPRATCGYDACTSTNPDMLNVHMVPHTHDDVGWLKTLDQYYYGSRTNIQRAGVQYILDSVVTELMKDPARRFIWVETSFFWKWWQEQDAVTQDQVRMLVDEGRLEVTGGAWSMHDEAGTHYSAIIDQFTWGFRILNDTLGPCSRPRVGWQIDPFGHARETASILARLGFDGVFLCRLDYQDKLRRLADKAMEMVWYSSPDNLGPTADIFSHATYNEYAPPPGFCFDILCSDEPMIDNSASADYNIPQRVQQFVDYVTQQAQYFRTNNIILTMGEDFYYADAHIWYKNMDKLIMYVNQLQQNGSNINLFYSTPACYLKAVHDANITFPTKQDDFFPYANDLHSYWTGYFTSKPTIKYFERLGNNFLQASKQLTALSGAGSDAGVTALREAVGVMQHHDAITGTMKAHVADDYSSLLHAAIQESAKSAESAVNALLGSDVSITSCLKLNVSECASSEDAFSLVVTIYNPLSRPVSHYVRLPVLGSAYSVRRPDGEEVATQVVPLHASLLGMVGRESAAEAELVFLADALPPMGLRSYYVTRLAASEPELDVGTKDFTIGNDRITLTLDDTGISSSLNINNISFDLQQSFDYYIGADKAGERPSGAYVFRPNGTDTLPLAIDNYVVYKGPLVEEVHQTFAGGWISQVIRVYREENHVEWEWMVGPIPVEDGIGKEIVSRFVSSLASNATFYSDSNGRELMKRVRNFRPTWNIEINEPVTSNYYPVVSKMLIRDEVEQHELAVLVDRAQGGSSLRDGEIELMVHRRLLVDDRFGVGEPLNETQYGFGLIARGKHWLVGGPTSTLAAQEKLLAHNKQLAPWTFFSPTGGLSFTEWASTYSMEYSGLVSALPDNVQILTLEPWKEGTLLIRLDHIIENGEDAVLSSPVTINLQDAFSGLTITGALEMTLGGNLALDELSRLQWNTESGREDPRVTTRAVDPSAITLQPMEIKTFVVEVTPVH